MRYVSDLTNKVFNSVKELEADDAKVKLEKEKQNELKEKRAARAKEVEDAIAHSRKLLNDFIKDYGSFYTSFTDPLFDLLELL